MDALYYYVWRRNGRNPRRKHATLDIAMREAERLSGFHPQSKFVVLAAVAEVGPAVDGDGSGTALPPADEQEKISA